MRIKLKERLDSLSMPGKVWVAVTGAGIVLYLAFVFIKAIGDFMKVAGANADNPLGTIFGGLVIGAAGLAAWLAFFLPTIVAGYRRHINQTPILILNVGCALVAAHWAVSLAWIFALAWAFTATNPGEGKGSFLVRLSRLASLKADKVLSDAEEKMSGQTAKDT